MLSRKYVAAALLLGLAAAAAPASAQQSDATVPPDVDSGSSASTGSQSLEGIEELRRRIDVLADEIERLRSGEQEQIEVSDARRQSLGLAPSAAATYRRATEGVVFSGYGELLLQKLADETESGVAGGGGTELDFLRAVLYAGYRFNRRFLFNSEIEFEHGGEEVGIEFAYVDYLLNDNLTLRGGMMLLPLGLVNEFHEPTVFIGARRPVTEQRILPSTWHENGGGVLGTYGPISFRAYLVNGFDAGGFSSTGLRGGRQGGVEAVARDWGFAGRLDTTPVAGVLAGVGMYRGGSGQGLVEVGGNSYDISTTIVEAHGQVQVRGLDLRALVARAAIGNAVALNRALGSEPGAPVAEEMLGGYAQLGYNVLSQKRSPLSVMPFVRLERVDTQHQVPAGFTRNLSADSTLVTAGLEFKPIPNVVLKVDHEWITTAAGTGRDQFNFNLGYAF